MGMSLDEVILRSTWNPAREIQHEELGNLSVGSPADVTVLRLEKGKFGFTDQIGARLDGTEKLVAELTMRDGKVVYDLNGITRESWEKIPSGARGGDPRWDSFTPAGRGGNTTRGDQKKQ
jgi:dihydroorotase